MKLKRSKYRGQISNYSSGLCWEIVDLGPDYVVQSFSEYYGMHQKLLVYDTKNKRKVAGFDCGLRDIRHDSADGWKVYNFIKELKKT